MRITLLWEKERHGHIDQTDLHMKGVKAKPFKDRLGAKSVRLYHTVEFEIKDSLDIQWKRRVEKILRRNPHFFRKDVRARIMVESSNPLKCVTLQDVVEHGNGLFDIVSGVYISARDPKEFSNRLCNVILDTKRSREGGDVFDFSNKQIVVDKIVSMNKTATKRVGKKRTRKPVTKK